MDTCIFCGFTFDGSKYRCENGSIRDDDGNIIDSTYCGNAYCPACSSCQGNTHLAADEHFLSVMKHNREIYEQRTSSRAQ
jgi:hypothetical protein